MSRLPASRGERLAAGVLVGGVIVFAVMAVALLRHGGGWVRAEMLTLLFALLAADLLIAAALLTGWYPVRPVAQGLAIFGAVVYLFVLLRSGPWWMRGSAAVLAGAHVYALVLLFALGARERYEDDEDDEDDEDGDLELDEPDEPDEEGADRPDQPSAGEPAVEVIEEPADEPGAAERPEDPVHAEATADEPGDPAELAEPAEPDRPEPVESAVGTARTTPGGRREEET